MFEESVSSIPSIWASVNSLFTPAVLFVLLNVMIGTIVFTSTLANQKHNHQKQQQNQQQQQQSQNDPQRPKLARSPSVLQRLRSINFYGYRSQEPQPLASNFEHNSDSDHHYNLQQAHEHQRFETHSQYLFEQPHEEKRMTSYEHPLDTQNQYYFEEINQEKPEELETHFDFQQPLDEKSEENETRFDLQQAHEEKDENEEPQSLDEVYSQLTERHVNRSRSDTKPSAGEIPATLPSKMRKSASMKSAFKHLKEEDIVEARRPATVRERGPRVTEADEEVDSKADDFINKFKQQLKLQRLDSIIRYKEMIGGGS